MFPSNLINYLKKKKNLNKQLVVYMKIILERICDKSLAFIPGCSCIEMINYIWALFI